MPCRSRPTTTQARRVSSPPVRRCSEAMHSVRPVAMLQEPSISGRRAVPGSGGRPKFQDWYHGTLELDVTLFDSHATAYYRCDQMFGMVGGYYRNPRRRRSRESAGSSAQQRTWRRTLESDHRGRSLRHGLPVESFAAGQPLLSTEHAANMGGRSDVPDRDGRLRRQVAVDVRLLQRSDPRAVRVGCRRSLESGPTSSPHPSAITLALRQPPISKIRRDPFSSPR